MQVTVPFTRPKTGFYTLQLACPMSPPVWAPQSRRLCAPALVTPTSHLFAEDEFRTEGKHQVFIREHPQNWSALFRDGLPTPPNEMGGVAYPMPQPGYGNGHQFNRAPLPLYPAPQNPRTNLEPLPSGVVPTLKSQNHPGSARIPPMAGLANTKRTGNGAVPPYLQIPPSINSSKGNLAEFAAQVCLGIHWESVWY